MDNQFERTWQSVAGLSGPDMETLIERVGDDPVGRVVGHVLPGIASLAAAARAALLAALRRAREFCDQCDTRPLVTLRMIDAAIARAEGQS